jgi:membrane protease YdiL (CAAX protease family)
MATVTPPVRVSASGADVRPGWVRRHPLAAFLLLCFGLTWAALIPAVADSRGWLPLSIPTWLVLPLAGWGPGLAAISVAVAIGRGGELVARITQWRLRLGWYAVALLGPGVLYVAAVALNALLGGTPSRLPELSPTLLVGLVLVFGFDLLTNGEEIGWRGLLLPCLLERYSLLEASLLVGVVSAAWHLPYFLWVGHPLASTPLAAFAVFTLAGSVILTWLYRGAGHSAVPAILVHLANATWPTLLPSAPAETRPFELYAGLYALVAGLLVVSRRVSAGGVEAEAQGIAE